MAFYKIDLPATNGPEFVAYVSAALAGMSTGVGKSYSVMRREPKLSDAHKAPVKEIVKQIQGSQFWFLGQLAERFPQLDIASKEQATAIFKVLDGHWVPDWLFGKCARIGIMISTAPRPAESPDGGEEEAVDQQVAAA